MEVKNERAALLSNYETLTLLKELQEGQNKQKKQHTNLATVSYEIIQYLENTACAKQSPEVISAFMKALEPFKLTRAEKLQLLNLGPRTAVEVQLIVEESEERLTEEQIYALLDIVATHLLPDEAQDDMEEGGDGQD